MVEPNNNINGNEKEKAPAAETAEVAGPQPGNAFTSVIKFILTILVVFGIAFLLRIFIFSPYEIPSGSMEETIVPGDMVFAEKVTYALGNSPQPGQIVTFNDPQKEGRTLIKRVIATEGQKVDLVDGHVVVDGTVLVEPYVDEGKMSLPLKTAPGVDIEYPYTVPEGHIWVMGDNRTASSDSRYFGSVPVSSVTGHANFRYWPLSRAGVLE